MDISSEHIHQILSLDVLQVSITQNSSFSTVVFHNSKLFDTPDMTTELLTSRVFSVKLHGEEKQVKKGFNIDLTMRVPLEGVAECRWYDTGNFRIFCLNLFHWTYLLEELA